MYKNLMKTKLCLKDILRYDDLRMWKMEYSLFLYCFTKRGS